MSISKRQGSPHYWYDFTVGGMRFRGSCETNDAATARTIEATLRREAALNKHLKRKPRLTLDAACARYWKEHGQFLPSAFSMILHTHRQLIAHFGKDTHLDEIDDAAVSRMVSEIKSTQIGTRDNKPRYVTPATINRKLECLNAVMHRARSHWGVETSEVDISRHKLRTPEARTRWLTPEEADQLIIAAAPHLKAPIRFALLTGLRLSNITGLQWEQVNLQARVMRFRVKSKLPGGKLLEIPISEAAFSLLMEQKPQKTGHVFLRHFKESRRTGKQRPPEPIIKFRRSFQTACKKAGIEDFHFHDLRHTAASWMIQRGVPLDVVQHVLGHSHISMTQKYAHRQTDDKASALEVLGGSAIKNKIAG